MNHLMACFAATTRAEWQEHAKEYFNIERSVYTRDVFGLCGFLTRNQDGSFDVSVAPDIRCCGLATDMFKESERLFGKIDLSKSTYTEAGKAWIRSRHMLY